MKMKYPKSKLNINFGFESRNSWAYSEGVFRGKSGLREEWFNLNYKIFRVREDGVVIECNYTKNIYKELDKHSDYLKKGTIFHDFTIINKEFTLGKFSLKGEFKVYYRCRCNKCNVEDILTPQQILRHKCHAKSYIKVRNCPKVKSLVFNNWKGITKVNVFGDTMTIVSQVSPFSVKVRINKSLLVIPLEAFLTGDLFYYIQKYDKKYLSAGVMKYLASYYNKLRRYNSAGFLLEIAELNDKDCKCRVVGSDKLFDLKFRDFILGNKSDSILDSPINFLAYNNYFSENCIKLKSRMLNTVVYGVRCRKCGCLCYLSPDDMFKEHSCNGVVDESYVVDFLNNIHRFDYSLESLLSCLDNKDSYGLNYKVIIDFHDLNNRINVLPEVTINKLVADKEFNTFIENLKRAIDSLDLFLNGDKGETKYLTYVYKKVSSYKFDSCIERILY